MAETVYGFAHTPREVRFSCRLTTFQKKDAIVPSLLHKEGKDAYKPLGRKRPVSAALQAYAALTTSAARGAACDLTQA